MNQPDPRRWWALAVVLTASFLALFDLFVVNVAAPSIARDLGAADGALQLVIAAYSFTYAVGLVTGARLGDRFGRRTLFLAGIALFTTASGLCGAAPTAVTLIAARLLQGAGAATMVPQVLATIQDLFGPTERARAFAAFGAVAGAGTVAGQALGGILLAANPLALGWRTAFLVQVPVGIAALAAGAWVLPRAAKARDGARLDPAGVALLTLALGLLLAPLTLGHDSGWPAWTFAALALAPAALAAFLAHQRRAAAPLLPLDLFHDRAFDAGLAINVAFYAEISSFFLIITILLQDRLGLEPLAAGLTFAPLGVAFAATSLLARPLIARYGPRVASAGLVVAALALTGQLLDIHFSGNAIDSWRLAPLFFAIGIGNGLVIPPLIGVSLVDVAPPKAGAASGMLATGQQFAIAAGVAVLSEMFFGALGHAPTKHSYLHAIQLVLLLDIGLLVPCFVASLLLPRRRAQARA
jgi:EmrB/QacA subfamily drug resistance transporter